LYFFAGIANVDWAHPLSAALLLAALLAGMTTGISFAFFRFSGGRLRQYKDDTGTIPLRGLDAGTNISMGLAGGAIVILAALMFIRMRIEIQFALGAGAGILALVIPLTLAIVSAAANFLVVAVYALDGSEQIYAAARPPATTEAHHLGWGLSALIEGELAMRKLSDRLLATHPEAQNLFAEAGHCHVLAVQSAAVVTQTFKVMQASRLCYEELRHRLDPCRTRTIHFGVAMTLQAAIFVVLVALDAIEFTGVLTGWMAVAAVAAAAAWSGCAWLAALAGRKGRRGLLAVITAGAATFGLLLTALHGAAAGAGPADMRYRLGVSVGVVLLIFALVAVASVLIRRTEPTSLLIARRRWHRARSAHEAAIRIHRSDAEAATVARQGWRSLIETQANTSGRTANSASHEPVNRQRRWDTT
jgi:hypothetical protein